MDVNDQNLFVLAVGYRIIQPCMRGAFGQGILASTPGPDLPENAEKEDFNVLLFPF